jgi:hypothetical protein
MASKGGRGREQVVVYMQEGDRDLLEQLAEQTGLSRTEIFRRGLRRLAEELLPEQQAGSSLDYLIAMAGDSEAPADLSERPDYYLYGGGYERHGRKARARAD